MAKKKPAPKKPAKGSLAGMKGQRMAPPMMGSKRPGDYC